jgi:hypothetical protein
MAIVPFSYVANTAESHMTTDSALRTLTSLNTNISRAEFDQTFSSSSVERRHVIDMWLRVAAWASGWI